MRLEEWEKGGRGRVKEESESRQEKEWEEREKKETEIDRSEGVRQWVKRGRD